MVIERRRGITRTVWLTRRWAVKVPSLRAYGGGLAGVLWSICRGILANQSETEWARNAPPDQAAQLCAPRWSLLGGVVNVYPRLMRITPEWCRAAHKMEWDELEMALFRREVNVTPEMTPYPGDAKLDNLGLTEDGRVVWLDYDMNWNGCPHDRGGYRNAQEREER